MRTELVKAVQFERLRIRNEVGEHQFRTDKVYPIIEVSKRKFFVPHHSATEGRTLRQHGRFHAGMAKQDVNGNWYGRGWPGTAYTFGGGESYGIAQAWDVNTVTYHAGYTANREAIGAVIEGNFNLRPPTAQELLMMLAMKVEADKQCQTRLNIKYHDEYKPGWGCPGQLWPKAEFARMEQQYYIDLNDIKPDDDEQKEQEPRKPKPKTTKPNQEDPAELPRADEATPPSGCLAFFLRRFKT